MSLVMQIESSVCNSTHAVQPHYTSEASSNSSSSQQEENATQTIPISAAPVLYTVTPASRTPGAGAQLVKVVSSPDGTGSQLIKVVSTAAMASTSPGGDQTAEVDAAAVVQRVEEPTGEAVLSQRVYSLVPGGQKSQNLIQKSPYNNGQQRVQTVTALPANARVLPVSSPQKVQILSNVVVAKQNIMLNKSQRQVITSLAQKQLNNNTNAKATIVTATKPATTVTKAINNLVITANQQPQGSVKSVTMVNQQKTLKTMSRAPQKTIKTLSPQSPQAGYNQKQAGIKTLSPQINHYSKMPNQVKLIPAQAQVSPRGGIKTLAPQRANPVNTRPNAVTSKPNYIGKHAAQAQKVQKPGPGKGRGAGQRLASPNKYNAQKQQSQVVNTQSSFNQSLTAQILQSLPSSGSRGIPETVYHSTVKSYPQLQSPPDDTSLSEDIGEEVRPDFSPNLSYLYQVVMLDHNYGAPPPAVSPPIARQPIGQQPANTLNGTVTGGSGGGQTLAGYYGTTVSGKRHGRLPANSTSTGPMSTSLPATHHISVQSGIDTRAAADDDAASTISSEGARPDDGDEGEETETAPEGEGDEDGVTRCICDFDHDDGYMICCDICSSWQHVDCMGLDRDHIPDKYSCVRCEPRRVDRQHARTIQQRKREEFARIGTLVQGPAAGGVGANSGSISDSSSETSTAESTGEGQHPPAGTRHHSVSLNNNLVGKKRTTPVSLSTRRKSEPASQNRRAPLAHKRQQRRESAREAIVAGRRTVAMKKREKKQVLKRKMKSRSSVDDDSQDSWPPAATTAYSNSMGASLLQLRQWIENYEEAVTNHYSPELRARITNMRANGTHTSPHHDSKQAPPNAQADVAVQKCKVSSQPLTGLKIVMSTQSLAANTPVIELRGKYMLSTQHRASAGPPGSASGGLLTRQHAQRPGPFLFFYRLPRDGTEVCVDTRTYGNDARFIRRSCRPNAELRHCVEKGTLHLYVITIASIEKNSELTIKHESHDLASAAASSAAGNSTSIPCACGNPQQCGLFTNHRKNGGNMHEPIAANNSSATSQPSNTTSNTNSANTAESKAPVEKLAVVTPATETNSATTHRKRRGRRASSPGRSVSPHPAQEPLPSPGASHAPVQPPPPPALSTRRASSHHPSRATSSSREVEKEELNPPQQQHPVQPPQSQQQSSQQVAPSQRSEKSASDTKDKKKKLTREERKIEAIVKAFERLEKAEQRKQEVQARQAQRRESDPSPSSAVITTALNRPQQENGEVERESMQTRRKKRKGRSRTISTTSQSSTRRRTRLNSTDSYMTSGDDSSLLSPPLPIGQEPALTPEPKHVDVVQSRPPAPESPMKSLSNSQVSELSSPSQVNTAAGLLLALANGGTTSNEQSINKSPEADGNSSGSNSSVQSSPGTPLSSACLLVAAAVGPLEPGFKFPKTKKAIMNEWLNKSPEPVQPVSSMSPMMTLHQATVLDQTDLGPQLPTADYYNVAGTANKSLATLVQAASLCDSPPQGAKAAMMCQGVGNAKKRWLRQAISEECDSPCSRPESPPGNAEMVAPPKKRRLARESLSSEQSFTPPTTPTMLVPPSNSLVEEDYPNNDEEFYTTEDRNVSNSSPPIQADFQKPLTKDTVSHQHLEIAYTEHIHSTSIAGASEMTLQHAELEPDNGLKDRCSEMQLDFGAITAAVKREDVMDNIAKKYPDTLSTSLLDPRLGRDRPIFRDSAQLLGTVEKTIRFYEENLTGPVPQVIQLQDELKEGKPEMVTPAKRKLSISEYRQRKQLSTGTGGGSSGGGGTPERPASPETPPPGGVRSSRGRSDSTSSATSSLSSDEEALGTATVDAVKPVVTVEPQVAVAFNSAPTAVERQRENVERLKKAFGLALDDDGRKTSITRVEPPQPVSKTLVSFTVQPSSSTDVGKPTSVVVAPPVAPVITPTIDTKYSVATGEPAKTERLSKRPSKDTSFAKVQNEEGTKMDVEEVKKVEQRGDDDLGYARFDETVSTSFIPPFNNPVYPNSTQFTSFTSVIDTSPYEGRNPSPPPPDLLTTTNNRSYPMSAGNSALTMSPSASYK